MRAMRALAGFALSVVFMELSLRLLIPIGFVQRAMGYNAGPLLVLQTEARLSLYEAPYGYVAFHPEFGWIPQPGVHEIVVPESVDERHERVIPGQPDASSAALRVLVVGDSFTYGSDVLDDQTWPARLVARSQGIHVRNIAAPGYSHGQMFLRMQRVLAEESFDMVVIGWMDLDMSRNRLRTTFLPVPWWSISGAEIRYHPLEPSWEQAVRIRKRSLRLALVWEAITEIGHREERDREVGRHLLRAMADASAAHGAEFHVALLSESWLLDTCFEAWSCVDVWDRLSDVVVSPDHRGDHFAPEENDVIAEAILEHISTTWREP